MQKSPDDKNLKFPILRCLTTVTAAIFQENSSLSDNRIHRQTRNSNDLNLHELIEE